MTGPAAHHELGASGAPRYLKCVGSVAAQRGKPDSSSVFAEEGTSAHEMAELILLDWQGVDVVKQGAAHMTAAKAADYNVDEMLREVRKYTEYVRDLCADDLTRLSVELRVGLSPAISGAFSTADAVVVAKDSTDLVTSIDVADLKYGKGKQVFADNNEQLRLYGYGVVQDMIADGALDEMFDDFADIPIRLHICQPRLDHFDSEEMTVQSLLDWIDDVVTPAVKRIEAGDLDRVGGSHCQFCKAAGNCKALAEFNTAELNDDFDDFVENGPDVSKPGEMSDAEVGQILKHKSKIETWLKAVKEHAYQSIENGGEVPGWKIVEGNNLRRWPSDAEALEAFKAQRALKQDEYAPRKLMSVAQADKALPSKSAVRSLFVVEKGKPKLVESSNKKSPMSFEGVESLFD